MCYETHQRSWLIAKARSSKCLHTWGEHLLEHCNLWPTGGCASLLSSPHLLGITKAFLSEQLGCKQQKTTGLSVRMDLTGTIGANCKVKESWKARLRHLTPDGHTDQHAWPLALSSLGLRQPSVPGPRNSVPFPLGSGSCRETLGSFLNPA